MFKNILQNNNLLLIILLIFVLVIFYKRINCKIERMSNTDNIKDEINKIYQADLQSIRNLSEIAEQLQKGGLNIPGDLTVKGNFVVEKDSTTKGSHFINKNLTTDGNSTTNGVHRNKGDIVFTGGNNWILHHPNDTRHQLYIAPSATKGKEDWKWDVGTDWNANGHKVFAGSAHVTGLLTTKELNITNGNGSITHFNHGNQSKNYLRGDAIIDGYKGTFEDNNAFGQGMHYVKVNASDNSNTAIRGPNNKLYHKDHWVCSVAGKNLDWDGKNPGRSEIYCYVGNNNHWHLKSEIENERDKGQYYILCIPKRMFNYVADNDRPQALNWAW